MDKSIMPECYADTLLMETLVSTDVGYNHKHNCFKVEAEMRRGKFKDSFALGIVDNDKRSVGYLSEFEKWDEVYGELILWKHKNYPTPAHFLIQICPALEGWVLTVCAQSGIETGYDLEGLKKRTKSMSSIKDKELKELFTNIRSQRHNCVSVQKLIDWVSLLKEKNYQVDINELKHGGRS